MWSPLIVIKKLAQRYQQPQIPAAASAQMLSHWVSQQKVSWAQTALWQPLSEQPGVSLAVQQSLPPPPPPPPPPHPAQLVAAASAQSWSHWLSQQKGS